MQNYRLMNYDYYISVASNKKMKKVYDSCMQKLYTEINKISSTF